MAPSFPAAASSPRPPVPTATGLVAGDTPGLSPSSKGVQRGAWLWGRGFVSRLGHCPEGHWEDVNPPAWVRPRQGNPLKDLISSSKHPL